MYSDTPEKDIDFLLQSADKNNKIGIIVDSNTKGNYSK
jgi:hypothetical protein